MGGRSAEEIVMGDITSGASGDIRMVTSTARHMVCDWGMTDLGPIAFGESQNHAYMGTMGAGSNNFSEETAQKIDKKIYDIVQQQYLRSLDILNEHRAALDTMAEALLEHETIDGVHVQEILDHGEMRSPIIKREIIESEAEPEEDSDDEVAKQAEEDDDQGDLSGEEAAAPSPA
jgi:cell division protease FtsH